MKVSKASITTIAMLEARAGREMTDEELRATLLLNRMGYSVGDFPPAGRV